MNKLSFAFANSADNNKAFTLNKDKAFQTTYSPALDFFSRASVSRADQTTVVELFKKAFKDTPDLAVVLAFHLRDIRGGQMERKSFQSILGWLFNNQRDVFHKIVGLVPEYGYWKDIIPYYSDPVVASLVSIRIAKDALSDNPSLLAKWMPSENASSVESMKMARAWARVLKVSMQEYRQGLSAIRNNIKVVERQMSAREWNEINFERVPSVAMKRYANAFSRRAPEKFVAYLEAVKKGEKKINASTLFPHDIVHGYKDHRDVVDSLEEQWSALPDYAGDENVLVMPDTSGSMGSSFNDSKATCLDVSVSLAIYFAERNKGAFNNQFVTFSGSPKFITLTEKTLLGKINEVMKYSEISNTNLMASILDILYIAKRRDIPQKDMPTKLIIISDMQFDRCGNMSTFEAMKVAFEAAGYNMPGIVFWNVNSYKNSPATKNEMGVALVSGASPSCLKYILSGKIESPMETMLKVAKSDRYKAIRECF